MRWAGCFYRPIFQDASLWVCPSRLVLSPLPLPHRGHLHRHHLAPLAVAVTKTRCCRLSSCLKTSELRLQRVLYIAEFVVAFSICCNVLLHVIPRRTEVDKLHFYDLWLWLAVIPRWYLIFISAIRSGQIYWKNYYFTHSFSKVIYREKFNHIGFLDIRISYSLSWI